jgi:hypothetical protein
MFFSIPDELQLHLGNTHDEKVSRSETRVETTAATSNVGDMHISNG